MAQKQRRAWFLVEDRLGDMTPFMDIIFLLLVFFLLTTTFLVPEKMIAQLLPTNSSANPTPWQEEQPQDLNILIYPEGFSRGMEVRAMDRQWAATEGDAAVLLQVANHPPLRISGQQISASTQASALAPVMDSVATYLAEQLAAVEDPGAPRDEQRPVIIHCFSALSWKYALVAYDAVLYFERDRIASSGVNPELIRGRQVSFAPPRLRNYHQWNHGNELWDILHMR